ncbi:MAG: NrfD/PsrC family molybdoenzyme membrane anchor subunit, partial [Anaerolineae bacterium]
MTSEMAWGWLVVLYLWLAGIAGGVYASAYMVHRLNGQRHRRLLRASAAVSLVLLAVGALLLIVDLGRPERFWHLFPQLRSDSVMWIGSYVLIILSVLWAGLLVWMRRGRPAAEAGDGAEGPLSALGFVLALV